MRVLLSAYACEPNRGSEPEIGWQRAMHMPAPGDEIWVLTRLNNQAVIEADPESKTPGLNFIYYDLPPWAMRLKKRDRFLAVYVLFWQWGAYRLAAMWHKQLKFDAVYHVTFSGILSGSFMGRLGIRFIVGPIGGGERAPLRLRGSMPLMCRLKELARDAGIVLQRFSPLTSSPLSAATRIFVSTPESMNLVREKWRSKTAVQLSVGHCSGFSNASESLPSPHARFVFAGRLLHWKGLHFALRALAEARKTMPDATLSVFGTGPNERWLRELSRRLGLGDAVEFLGHIPRPILEKSLSSYSAFVFPSLHDSGGLVVLEALSKGLPVICLDLGGPGSMINRSCGVAISTADASESQVVTAIAEAMISIGSMPESLYRALSERAIARARELSWEAVTERVKASREPKPERGEDLQRSALSQEEF